MKAVASMILLKSAIYIISLGSIVQSFSIPSNSITSKVIAGDATTSRLFQPQNHLQSRTISFSPIIQLNMAEEESDGKDGEAVPTGTESNEVKETKETPKKERNGFWTAIILAPPLIAKFGIVLICKVITDLIVFPLLFLFRISKSAKNKIVGIFKKDDLLNGDSVNGAWTLPICLDRPLTKLYVLRRISWTHRGTIELFYVEHTLGQEPTQSNSKMDLIDEA